MKHPVFFVRWFAAAAIVLAAVAGWGPVDALAIERGLFVELDGFRGAGMGTNPTHMQDNKLQSAGTANQAEYVQAYGYRTPRAWGGAAYVGYWLRDRVAVVLGASHATYQTVPVVAHVADSSGGDRVDTTTEEISNTLLTLGARLAEPLGPGRLRVGAGFAFLLPYEMTTVEVIGNEGTYTTRREVGASLIGGYGAIGWDVTVFKGLSAGLALKVHIAQSRRDGTVDKVRYSPESGIAEDAQTRHRIRFQQSEVRSTTVGNRQVPSLDKPYSQVFADARLCLVLGWAF